jgi:hypothetical protein
MDDGAAADARAASAALRELVEQGRETLALAVSEAPIDSPEHAREHHDRPPGHLRESARLVIIVNQDEFDGDNLPAATARVRELALARQLYKVDVEIRFEAVYARHQHDRLQFKHPHGGKSKYLEHPIQIARPGLRSRLEKVMS